MEYNTERKNMIIPEYGRNIHKMIEYAITIKDRKERNKCAWGIIRVMGDLNPHLRDVPDFQHKLWDQLFIMSNFQLDVDSPFPKPEELKIPPKKMQYPERLKEFRYYGKIIKDLIKIAINCLDEDKKEGLIYAIANTMKKSHFKWNKDTVQDNIIIDDLKKLSGYKLYLNASNNDPLVNVEHILNYSKKRNKNQSYYIKKKKFFNHGHI